MVNVDNYRLFVKRIGLLGVTNFFSCIEYDNY